MASTMWFHAREPGAKRVLFHVRSRVGLGHLNRSIAVAQMLSAGIPQLQVLFLIESGGNLVDAAGFPWILIGQPVAGESEHCEQMARSVLNAYHPDVVIYETFLHEEVYRPVQETGVKQAVMASLGEGLRKQFREKLSVLNMLDLLLILQQKQELIPRDLEILSQYQGRTVFAGPLVRRKVQVAPDELRQKLGLSENDKVILLTCGGGGYTTARELVENLLAARTQILAHYPQAKLIIISGPHFVGDLPKTNEFLHYASKFEPFLTDYFEIASAIVCMAGYSTVNEVAGSGIPAICVPTAEAGDQVGVGSMSEYAESFPNMVVSTTDTEELAQKVIAALGRERNFSAVRDFWQRAEEASQSIVREIKALVDANDPKRTAAKIKEIVDTAPLEQTNSRIKHMIAVMGGKGGVGKSIVTALLAVALQQQGQRVGILDADLACPSIARLFHLEEEPLSYTEEGVEPPLSQQGIKVFSVNMSENEDEPLAWRGPMVSSALKQFWDQVYWGELDFLLVDVPAGTADVPLTVLQALPVNGVVIVSTPQAGVAATVKKCIKLVQQQNQPILGIVENMAYLQAAGRARSAPNSSGASAELTALAHAPLLAQLPLDPQLATLADEGRIEEYTSAACVALVNKLIQALEQ